MMPNAATVKYPKIYDRGARSTGQKWNSLERGTACGARIPKSGECTLVRGLELERPHGADVVRVVTSRSPSDVARKEMHVVE